jgi:hypothetical protein
MSSAQGRFTSPDPLTGTVLHLINPQRWNMYSYGLNNPLFYTDPDGRDAIAVDLTRQVDLAHISFGHEGVVSLHKDGTATYARFGPEHQGSPFDVGVVSVTDLPKVDFDANGVPTPASFDRLAKAIGVFEEGQDPSTLKFAFFKTSEADTNLLDSFFDHFNGPNRFGSYSGPTHNCADFCASALTVGKVLPRGINYFGIPNLLQFYLNLFADATYQQPKKPDQEEIAPSHHDCLINRNTGQCVQ